MEKERERLQLFGQKARMERKKKKIIGFTRKLLSEVEIEWKGRNIAKGAVCCGKKNGFVLPEFRSYR